MISFSVQILSAISTWLGSPPMIYIIGLLIFAVIFKLFIGIFSLNKY